MGTHGRLRCGAPDNLYVGRECAASFRPPGCALRRDDPLSKPSCELPSMSRIVGDIKDGQRVLYGKYTVALPGCVHRIHACVTCVQNGLVNGFVNVAPSCWNTCVHAYGSYSYTWISLVCY